MQQICFIYFFIGFYFLTSPIIFRFDFFERMNRTRKQRLDRISAQQSVYRQIDRSINTCNLIEICICEANGCEVGFSEIVSALGNEKKMKAVRQEGRKLKAQL